ncbi:MAG: EF-P lysine aminoacylase EpmA [Gammaproteobacteria bacterium]|nr:EF-P lysine aminoacylase EpmA [Gammaproteobacteria bacterium]
MNLDVAWRPTASLETLQSRASLLRQIREFFHQRGVLEVETPALSLSANTDPHIESVEAALNLGCRNKETVYLHTSPEFAMKRLLAAGSGDIYQLCKVYRDEERGKNHQPEFTMLEWYRVGMSYLELMSEVERLVSTCFSGLKQSEILTVSDAFQNYCELDIFTAKSRDLKRVYEQKTDTEIRGLDPDDWDAHFGLLLDQVIEPELAQFPLAFLHQFPPSQASLAMVEQRNGHAVALRFECFINGMEIANGFQELTDAKEQGHRFERDNQRRRRSGRKALPIDQKLLGALQAGLPSCSGVALGVDRLLMQILGKDEISKVLSFSL